MQTVRAIIAMQSKLSSIPTILFESLLLKHLGERAGCGDGKNREFETEWHRRNSAISQGELSARQSQIVAERSVVLSDGRRREIRVRASKEARKTPRGRQHAAREEDE